MLHCSISPKYTVGCPPPFPVYVHVVGGSFDPYGLPDPSGLVIPWFSFATSRVPSPVYSGIFFSPRDQLLPTCCLFAAIPFFCERVNLFNFYHNVHMCLFCKVKCKRKIKWRVLSQNGLSAIFDIFKVRTLSYNTK